MPLIPKPTAAAPAAPTGVPWTQRLRNGWDNTYSRVFFSIKDHVSDNTMIVVWAFRTIIGLILFFVLYGYVGDFFSFIYVCINGVAAGFRGILLEKHASRWLGQIAFYGTWLAALGGTGYLVIKALPLIRKTP